jgi:hypothetical protein
MTTAPALNNANTSEMNSQPGGTSKAIRVCGETPRARNPLARRLVSSSSWRKV